MHPLAPSDPVRIGPHRLLARLGAGGMGEVYLARTPADRLAAVKVTRAELAQDREFRARFAREVRTARMVTGPFTPAVVDADPDAPAPWMATEYVPGPTLKEAVRENGTFPEPSLLVLTLGLARALQSIHAAGLVHRDLKPSNVLLSPRGPQVIDFGIARAVEGTVLTKTGQSFGTPSYTSPEQVLGQEVGRTSDVFSLAGVVVHAATGRAPFGKGPAAEVLSRLVSRDPDLDGVPENLRPLLTRCLAKNPTERPSSDEILSELSSFPLPAAEHGWLPIEINRSIDVRQQEARQAVHSGGATSRGASGSDVPRPKRRRAGLIAAGAGTAALILGAGVALAVVSPWKGDETTEEIATGQEGSPEDSVEEEDAPGINGSVYGLFFTPDGDELYVHTATELTRWAWESGEMLERYSTYPGSLDIADDGTVVTAHQPTVLVRDPDFETLAQFKLAEEPSEDILFHDTVSISPDASLVALTVVTQERDSRLYLWDWREDTVVFSTELEEPLLDMRFDQTGELLLLTYRDIYPRVFVHDVETFEEVVSGPGSAPDSEYDFQFYPSAISPTGDIMSIHMDDHVLVYDLEKGENLHEIPLPLHTGGLVFSPDGTILYSSGASRATGDESGGRAWDVASGEELTSGHTLLLEKVTPHPDGELLVTVEDQTLLVLDAETFELVSEIG
ncbi:WD40 repeat domain-containing serine/threonine protein kinase [Nocardiopsis alba]|uniref:WD40 repeat domain-containing serine/threonine protein kinase n=1 Tax=Nocardiopsis alba TaxID=53437 RepID=UPI0005A996E4|nr:WD40 repeat domain-containing serine/threonine protein kinase [Nocardiopsis alba]